MFTCCICNWKEIAQDADDGYCRRCHSFTHTGIALVSTIRADLLAAPVREKPFGCWVYDDALLVIRHEVNGYEIDLEKITSSASMLDWIFHVTDKLWCSPEDARDLLRILRKAFSPYDTLCGGSMNGSTGTLIADPANVIRKNVGLR